MTGRILGFGARILKSNDKAPKYINTPENELYVKSKVLYGMYQSRSAISKLDECLLVEGYTDVISLHQGGVENVVSSSGTSLTEDQLRLIGELTKNLTILYDGDSAGIRQPFAVWIWRSHRALMFNWYYCLKAKTLIATCRSRDRKNSTNT